MVAHPKLADVGRKSLAAVLFGIKFKHAFISIFIGVIIAGIIVTSLWTGLSFAFGSLDFAGLW